MYVLVYAYTYSQCTSKQGRRISRMEVRTEVNTLSMVEARDQLTHLPEQFAQDLEKHSSATAIKVTRRNKPVLAILPWELYESIVETLEILSDEEQMTELRQGLLQEKE